MADSVRKLVQDADWSKVPAGNCGKGAALAVQLPSPVHAALMDAAVVRGIGKERLILGALAVALS